MEIDVSYEFILAEMDINSPNPHSASMLLVRSYYQVYQQQILFHDMETVTVIYPRCYTVDADLQTNVSTQFEDVCKKNRGSSPMRRVF